MAEVRYSVMERCCPMVGAAFLLCALSGCVTTQQQADGATKVNVSLADAFGVKPKTQVVTSATLEPKQGIALPSSIRSSSLAGLFTKHPYDGTAKTYFPRAAITVTDWSRNDCWAATATIWLSKTNVEAVPAFSVCWGKSVGYAVNNAANLHLFMQQTAVEHSGNVRTTGPKPPMLAIPDRQPISERLQLAFQGFIQQLLLDTGWQPGAPTNLWLVGYDANGGSIASYRERVTAATDKPMDSKARQILERALSCTAIDKQFSHAEAVLKQAGWKPEQGVAPITLPEPLKVYGLSTAKIAVSRDGFEHTYRSLVSGVSVQQVIKAASLKLGKDGKNYGRTTKIGVLTVGTENGETALTCTVDAEGAEG